MNLVETQLLTFWTLSIILFLLFKNDIAETELCLHPQVKAYSLGPNLIELVHISRNSIYKSH
jgi:hypothetical protein